MALAVVGVVGWVVSGVEVGWRATPLEGGGVMLVGGGRAEGRGVWMGAVGGGVTQ